MSALAGILLIISIVGLVKLHKEKGKDHPLWFSRRNCIIVLVVGVLIAGFASSSTPTPVAVKSVPTVATVAKPVKVVVKTPEQVKKDLVNSTIAGIISDNWGLTTLKAATNGILGITYTNNTYNITYQYTIDSGTDITAPIGNELANKIQSIYQKYPNVDQIQFLVYEPMQDNLGNAFLKFGISFDFSRDLNSQINWTNFDPTKLTTIATNVATTGPMVSTDGVPIQ